MIHRCDLLGEESLQGASRKEESNATEHGVESSQLELEGSGHFAFDWFLRCGEGIQHMPESCAKERGAR